MKQRFLFALMILAVLCLSACSKTPAEPDISGIVPLPPVTTYYSLEEFENSEKQNAAGRVEAYYVPILPEDQYTLSSVTKREGVYVSVTYRTELPEDLAKQLRTEYDRERCQQLICETSLLEDSSAGLQQYISNGYQETVVNGRTVYRWDEYAENSPAQPVIGYEIVFLAEGKRIFMHLPGVGSFEEMIQYADPVKRVIE
ncbi:MAG: hypothetical protein J5493_05685 [Lachnospiraceae bacterium]|nr:hypothetical protein [Lachnospiraceae bacterium]